MTSRHHVSELDAMNGTKPRPKLWPKSGPSWDQVIFQPPTQLATQLHKISSSQNAIKSVIKQVGEHVAEQVFATNHREHRDIAAEVESTTRVTAKVTAYPGACKT